MLEIHEQNCVPPSQTSEVLDESTGGGGVTPKAHEERTTNDSNSHMGTATSDHLKTSRDQSNDDGGTKVIDYDVENNDARNHGSGTGDGRNPEYRFQSLKEAVNKIDKYKVRAAFEKWRKECGSDANRRTEFMDDDDFSEREILEDRIELVGESEKRKGNWCDEIEDLEAVEEGEVDEGGGDRQHRVVKQRLWTFN